MIAGNPKAPQIMGDCFRAYRKHGLSVQGLLPAFRSSAGQGIERGVFWRKALAEWCRVDGLTATHTVADLERATRTKAQWEMKDSIERAVRAARGGNCAG